MRKFFRKYHRIIDFCSIGFFLYFLFVFLFSIILSFVKHEAVYITLVLLLPMLVVNRKNIERTNLIFHKIFRFRR